MLFALPRTFARSAARAGVVRPVALGTFLFPFYLFNKSTANRVSQLGPFRRQSLLIFPPESTREKLDVTVVSGLWPG